MRFEWDAAKNDVNVEKHGVDFVDAVEAFDGPLLTTTDNRRDYGETRNVSIGIIAGRVHVIVWTRRGDVIRLISVRRANAKETRRFDSTP